MNHDLYKESPYDIEIPLAKSPDLITALLDFEADAFAEEHPTGVALLLEKACELSGWSLSGQHPRYLINQWVEVMATGRGQTACRLLNSRTQQVLKPFTLSNLLKTVEKLLKQLEAHQTPPQFEETLSRVMHELGAPEVQVRLNAVFLQLRQARPDYSREAFGLDLTYALLHPPENQRFEPVAAQSASLDRFWLYHQDSLAAFEALELIELQLLNMP